MIPGQLIRETNTAYEIIGALNYRVGVGEL